MAEGLSSGQNKNAEDFYTNEQTFSKEISENEEKLRPISRNLSNMEEADQALKTASKESHLYSTAEMPSNFPSTPKFKEIKSELESDIEKTTGSRDANRWRSEQHYKANKEAYIETARQEAADKGIDIQGPALSDNPDHPA